MTRGLLSVKRVGARLASLPGYLVPEALGLGSAADVLVCGCVFVVASRRTGASLVTPDEKLIAKLAGRPDAASIIHTADWK